MLAQRAVLSRPRHFQLSACLLRRDFSTSELGNGITLAYDLYEPPKDAKESSQRDGSPIVFIHGLFGSKVNHRSVSKQLVRDLKRPIYCLDMRNHGDSSHNPTHNFSVLAEDVELFLQKHNLRNPTMIGHSMGAKTVMTLALRNKVQIANLIPVDSAPVDAALSSDFKKYVQGMRKIDESNTTKQSEADKILQEYEENLGIRQFLLANLIRNEDGVQRFRIPVKTLTNALDHLADFPFTDPDVTRWEGPMLMIRGTRSHYVADEMLPIVGRFFPNFVLADVDAGHWVISEKPEEFRKAVVEFLQDKD